MPNDKKKVKIKTQIDNNELPKDLEIQDSTLNVDSNEERPGVGYEIFGIPYNP